MTQPDDPYGTPQEQPPTPPAGAQPPPYGQPQYGQPQYGQPQYGEPQYGQPPQGYGYAPPQGGYASWLERVGAFIIDALVPIPGYVLAGIGAAIGGGFGALLVIVGYIGAIVVGVWNYVFRQGKTGKSIGKQTLGLMLIGESSGGPIGPGMAFVRWIAQILNALPCYLGYLWPLWDDKRQTFADKVCSTVVIHRR